MKSGRMPGERPGPAVSACEKHRAAPRFPAVPPLTFGEEHGILFPKENGEDGGFPAASCRKNKARE